MWKKNQYLPVGGRRLTNTGALSPFLLWEHSSFYATMEDKEEKGASDVNPYRLLQKYYPPCTPLYRLLLTHGLMVARKALQVADRWPLLALDRRFIYEAAILHDIGIFLTNAPSLGCYGTKPYICHGYLGREILEREGYPRHALVAERHVGVGITREEIIQRQLPLPPRDMVPQSWEEKIIAYADKFFSKGEEHLTREKTLAEIEADLGRIGPEKVAIFRNWHRELQGQQ
ncbi:HD domain-containing protein [Desulfothermobacter acidiphilus]|uniref:HD domain-containing protein n=1 Tax=Desulfothermobacter acidiphilus TaxID=1938353 RepID=UPI003F8B4B99